MLRTERANFHLSGDGSVVVSEAAISFTIGDVAGLKSGGIIESPSCTVLRMPWKILVKPKYNDTSVGFFLHCDGHTDDNYWYCKVSYDLIIINYKEKGNFSRHIDHVFQGEDKNYHNCTDWGYNTFMPWADLINPDQGYITKDGGATFQVRMVVDPPNRTTNWYAHNIIRPAFDSSTYSDIKIVHAERTFACHKLILGSNSSVFHAMFTRRNDWVENSTKEIAIDDIDVGSLATLLRFMYSEPIDVRPLDIPDLFLAADKYDVQPLKTFLEHMLLEDLRLGGDALEPEEICLILRFTSFDRCDERVRELIEDIAVRKTKLLEKSAEWKDIVEKLPRMAKRLRLKVRKCEAERRKEEVRRQPAKRITRQAARKGFALILQYLQHNAAIRGGVGVGLDAPKSDAATLRLMRRAATSPRLSDEQKIAEIRKHLRDRPKLSQLMQLQIVDKANDKCAARKNTGNDDDEDSDNDGTVSEGRRAYATKRPLRALRKRTTHDEANILDT